MVVELRSDRRPETTLAMLKPDAVGAGKARDMMQRIELAGFTIVAHHELTVRPPPPHLKNPSTPSPPPCMPRLPSTRRSPTRPRGGRGGGDPRLLRRLLLRRLLLAFRLARRARPREGAPGSAGWGRSIPGRWCGWGPSRTGGPGWSGRWRWRWTPRGSCPPSAARRSTPPKPPRCPGGEPKQPKSRGGKGPAGRGARPSVLPSPGGAHLCPACRRAPRVASRGGRRGGRGSPPALEPTPRPRFPRGSEGPTPPQLTRPSLSPEGDADAGPPRPLRSCRSSARPSSTPSTPGSRSTRSWWGS